MRSPSSSWTLILHFLFIINQALSQLQTLSLLNIHISVYVRCFLLLPISKPPEGRVTHLNICLLEWLQLSFVGICPPWTSQHLPFIVKNLLPFDQLVGFIDLLWLLNTLITQKTFQLFVVEIFGWILLVQNGNGSLSGLLKLLACLLVFFQLFNLPLLVVDLRTFERSVGETAPRARNTGQVTARAKRACKTKDRLLLRAWRTQKFGTMGPTVKI